MRTYDDTFSGQKIYPGKVRYAPNFDPRPLLEFRNITTRRCSDEGESGNWTIDGIGADGAIIGQALRPR